MRRLRLLAMVVTVCLAAALLGTAGVAGTSASPARRSGLIFITPGDARQPEVRAFGPDVFTR